MNFYKLEATNNDFIITINESINSNKALKLCADHSGIGADGLINIDKNNQVSIYNKDGSIAAMCGNGMRCLAYVLSMLDKKKTHYVFLNNEKIEITLEKNNYARVQFNTLNYYKINGCYFVDCLNKHLIILLDKIENFDFNENHFSLSLKNKCNIHAVAIKNKNTILIKTYEYGVGKTKSCGSGSIAAFFLLNSLNLLSDNVNIVTEGGLLNAKIINNKYYLSGPVNLIYKGEIINGIL